ncbi:short-chain dehydrogenase [Talaromyces pinophilus]|uniref:Short-chain dehydrogenase n=1 Tax=Talaromyces pinophilus TaxID=128442 RepID=A0A6V8HPW1_TALPI|nr:short-chain dehydrogenase [Talaromyces pinophilus]
MLSFNKFRPQGVVANLFNQTRPTLIAPDTFISTRSYSIFQKTLDDPLRTSPTCFAGKTVLVTGANTGLGFEAALKSFGLHAKHVILGVRDVEKGEQAKQRILQTMPQIPLSLSETTRDGNPTSQRISVRKLDMSDYDSIHNFVNELAAKDGPLDVAILNAGVFGVKYEPLSKYGWENDLQVNVLSTALLSLLLLHAKAIKPKTGVLEFVASRRMRTVRLTEEEKNAPSLLEVFNRKQEKFDASRQYQVSKLLLVAFYKSLATRSANLVQGSPIITAVCPGFCQSNLSRGHQGFAADVLRAVLNTFVLRRTEEGARTLVTGTIPEEERHGRFWYDDELHDVMLPDNVGDTQQFANKILQDVITAIQCDTSVPVV